MSLDGSSTPAQSGADRRRRHRVVPIKVAGGAVEAFVLLSRGPIRRAADPGSTRCSPPICTCAPCRPTPTSPALEPTWDNVYANVLANWKAMAPCMDNWLDLDDEAQVRAYRAAAQAPHRPRQFRGSTASCR